MTRELVTPRGTVLIREAKPADAIPFRELRLGALQDSPTAFSADYQKNLSQPLKHWEDMLAAHPDESTIFLAIHEGHLVGMTGIVRGNSPKTRHSAMIWGVYVKSAWRGVHIAEELIRSCLQWAKTRKVVLAKLGVVSANTSAIRCYERCGFKVYGTEPQAICYEGKYYDELLMARPLDNS